ncbi:MAG TPA: transketolase [Steroidobacteraceae bacterium]|nr:transketolase [Steroidobacteraceae bacterium]HQW09724.1 transketolase [Steroidobacteraceae bacterium]HQX45884.1 transketolase [Steroidobacteraceae bacterium]HQX79371.1 transketolase [Steroidobacteraceae bacterium]HQZ80689.1 transketolase [Steroidobacteraceae bacterium]
MPTRRELANAIRALAMDAVQAANSGHPGAPMGMADIAEVLWRDVLKHNPANPRWVDRDRFVLSNGHASMLLYALLHLTGYPLALDELRKFRQLGARTAGHPERDLDIGIETTTGPLGQGFANAVGMALAEKMLAAQFNRDDHEIVDHHTYVFLGDGCLMEGLSHEAASLAGTLKLGKLIAVYDNNGISIDGEVKGWFTDDVAKRFAAYGWHVLKDVDGHDASAVASALRKARAHKQQPTIILARTIIGFGAPNKQGTNVVHGEALGTAEVAAARATLGWPYPPFEVPEEIRAAWDARARGAAAEKSWQRRYRRYQKAWPELAAEFERRMAGRLPQNFAALADAALEAAQAVSTAQATRASSGAVLNVIGPGIPELVGGSADLTGSVNTQRKDSRTLTADDASGNYIHYGVREFAMTAVMSGFTLHGGIRPYGGTFLVFSDYARNAVRLASLMHQPVVLVYTHDSIGLGEDGPTHQPVEHLASLRAMPGLSLWRPGDAVETAIAWRAALERGNGPVALVLTRQALPQQARTREQLAAAARGGYTLIDCEGEPEAILIATGSELALAAEALRVLATKGRRIRLVSMPSTDVFEAQEPAWREAVLPRAVTRRVAVEAGARQCWWRYVGLDGEVIGIDRFGASGKGAELFRHFGFTTEHVVAAVEKLFI